MKQTLAITFYSLLWWPVGVIALFRLYIKSIKQPSYRNRISERFGFWPKIPTGAFWVHAVSVGEVIACKNLVDEWRAQHPSTPILITTMTPTGSDTVKKLFADDVYHAYLPWDFFSIQRRLIRSIKPMSLTIMETELWPNLIHACHRQKVPVIVANARLSERSYRGYQRFSALTIPMLKAISGIAAQYEADAHRFKKLGVESPQLKVTGSIKFDIKIDAELKANITKWKSVLGNRPIWIAASTHPGEEEQLLAVHKKILTQLPSALLILVPRHIDRTDKVIDLIRESSFTFTRRSTDSKPNDNSNVFLVDTLGELMLFYGIANVAFIGNSLNHGGGHNPIEPAALSVPIISGSSYVNFQTIFDAMHSQNAAIIIESADQLAEHLSALLNSKDKRDDYGQNGFAFYRQQQGALQRLSLWIEDLVK